MNGVEIDISDLSACFGDSSLVLKLSFEYFPEKYCYFDIQSQVESVVVSINYVRVFVFVKLVLQLRFFFYFAFFFPFQLQFALMRKIQKNVVANQQMEFVLVR